jgi:hypothetical protein
MERCQLPFYVYSLPLLCIDCKLFQHPLTFSFRCDDGHLLFDQCSGLQRLRSRLLHLRARNCRSGGKFLNDLRENE